MITLTQRAGCGCTVTVYTGTGYAPKIDHCMEHAGHVFRGRIQELEDRIQELNTQNANLRMTCQALADQERNTADQLQNANAMVSNLHNTLLTITNEALPQ